MKHLLRFPFLCSAVVRGWSLISVPVKSTTSILSSANNNFFKIKLGNPHLSAAVYPLIQWLGGYSAATRQWCVQRYASWPVVCASQTPDWERPLYSWKPPCRQVGRRCWLRQSSSSTLSCLKWSRQRSWERSFLLPCISSRPDTSSGPVPSSVCCRRCLKVHPHWLNQGFLIG